MLVYQRVHGAPPWTLRFFHVAMGYLAREVTRGVLDSVYSAVAGLRLGGIGETRMVQSIFRGQLLNFQHFSLNDYLGGGFKDSLCSPLIFGEMIRVDSYFSKGLVQPPKLVNSWKLRLIFVSLSKR